MGFEPTTFTLATSETSGFTNTATVDEGPAYERAASQPNGARCTGAAIGDEKVSDRRAAMRSREGKLSESTVARIKALPRRPHGPSDSELAALLGVSNKTIGNMRRVPPVKWKDVAPTDEATAWRWFAELKAAHASSGDR